MLRPGLENLAVRATLSSFKRSRVATSLHPHMLHGVGLEPTTPGSSSIRRLQFRFMSKPVFLLCATNCAIRAYQGEKGEIRTHDLRLIMHIVNIAVYDFIKSYCLINVALSTELPSPYLVNHFVVFTVYIYYHICFYLSIAF